MVSVEEGGRRDGGRWVGERSKSQSTDGPCSEGRRFGTKIANKQNLTDVLQINTSSSLLGVPSNRILPPSLIKAPEESILFNMANTPLYPLLRPSLKQSINRD
jgi:hypothetical protein